MQRFATPAVLLRRVDYGDFDRICTFFTQKSGKQAAMAKSAKRSVKRFGGSLELFSVLQIVYRFGGGKGLPLLEEATLTEPLVAIRADIRKTAYASYWVEVVDKWSESGAVSGATYRLLTQALRALDHGEVPAAIISVWFQMHYITMAGFEPMLGGCHVCRRPLEGIPVARIRFDLKRGGLVCGDCSPPGGADLRLTKGTIKQLLWIGRRDLTKAGRMRFSDQGLAEGLHFLEAFVPFHLDKEPRSLKFLRQVR